jgi:hypothetical protein
MEQKQTTIDDEPAGVDSNTAATNNARTTTRPASQ